MNYTFDVMKRIIPVLLALHTMIHPTAFAQDRSGQIEIRPTIGISLFGLPELSRAHPFSTGEYRGPDVALGGGISFAYWASMDVTLSLGIEYHRFVSEYAVNPLENKVLSNVWRVELVPIILRCEYVTPFHISLFSPFVGLGAGLSFCNIEYGQNYAEPAIRYDAFSFRQPVHNVFTLDIHAGLLFDVSQTLGGSLTFAFWRTGNTHHLDVRTIGGAVEGLEMFVTGFSVSLSARL